LATIVGIIALGRWAKKRREATGQIFPLLWTSLALIVVIPGLTVLIGGNPLVWISNNYSNPGPTIGRAQVRRVPGVGGAADTFTVSGVTGLSAAQQNLAELARRGAPNYFGEQRFGKRGANLQKGLDVLRGNARQFAARMPRRVFGLVLSAVQSEVFNRVVMARLHTLDTLLPGDLAWKHDNGACFPVVDVAAEQPRCAAFAISPSGPMPGPEMTLPTGEPAAIEAAALAALELRPEQFANLPFNLARGERRPLRVPVTEVAAEALADGALRLAFTLPKGAYATSVLRELLDDTIWFGGD
jgi:tRNA(Glu) U13 pseudouridine synthase TruD